MVSKQAVCLTRLFSLPVDHAHLAAALSVNKIIEELFSAPGSEWCNTLPLCGWIVIFQNGLSTFFLSTGNIPLYYLVRGWETRRNGLPTGTG